MSKRMTKTSNSRRTMRGTQHRFEHWHVDNQVYFITVRCQERFPAFADEPAKAIFWDRFEHYTQAHGFTPWVTSLLDNHYHTIGYLKVGSELPTMMQRIHGSVAKLVNDHLRANNVYAPWLPAERASARGSVFAPGSKPNPQPPSNPNNNPRAKERSAGLKFWGDKRGHEYFDGCLRDVKQGRLTYRYIQTQSKRHGVCDDYQNYPHTKINIEVNRAIKRAAQLDAFLTGVPYARYQKPKQD
ncbi:MAG: transposase [Phycisphaeraceae bacterium]